MTLNCTYPGCKTVFPVDCPTSEITQHLLEVHRVDVFNPADLVRLNVAMTIFELIGHAIEKGKIPSRDDCTACKNGLEVYRVLSRKEKAAVKAHLNKCPDCLSHCIKLGVKLRLSGVH